MNAKPLSILACVAAVACAACTPLATWPPTEGRAVLAPWAEPCPQLMATSVAFTRKNTSPDAPLVFNLPPGTEWKVWEEVRRRLGPDARAMVAGDSSVFDVRQIRLDGGLGEVDVVYRTPEGVWQMATVHFSGAFGADYRPKYFQRWVIPVDPPVPHDPGPPPQRRHPDAGTEPTDDGSAPSEAAAPPADPATGAAGGTVVITG